jgi:hypothetical protein
MGPKMASDIRFGYSDYETEKGFLAEGNFAADERNAIKSCY